MTEVPYYLTEDYIDWKREYREKCRSLEECFEEVLCMDFYRDLFPCDTIETD